MRKLLLAAALLFCALPASATITYNRVSIPNAQSGTATTLNYTVTSSTGNLVSATIVADANATVTGCSDNKSNSYTLSAGGSDATTGKAYVCYAFSATTAITQFNVTVATCSGQCHVGVYFYDCSSSSGGAIDGSVVTYSSQTTASPALSVAAAGAGFSIAAVTTNNPATATVTYTNDGVIPGSFNYYGYSAHYVNGSGGTLTATFTAASTTHWSGVIVEFKESGGATPKRYRGAVIGQ